VLFVVNSPAISTFSAVESVFVSGILFTTKDTKSTKGPEGGRDGARPSMPLANRLTLFCVGESQWLAFALRRWLPYRVSRDAKAFTWRLHYPLDLDMSFSDFRDEVYNTPLVRLTLVYKREEQTVEFLVVTEDYEKFSAPADKKALTHVLREKVILPYLAFHYGAKKPGKVPIAEEPAIG
jgi:hypothetical protein